MNYICQFYILFIIISIPKDEQGTLYSYSRTLTQKSMLARTSKKKMF